MPHKARKCANIRKQNDASTVSKLFIDITNYQSFADLKAYLILYQLSNLQYK